MLTSDTLKQTAHIAELNLNNAYLSTASRIHQVQQEWIEGRNCKLSLLYGPPDFFFFFFLHWHCSPLWALAGRTRSFHFFLSVTNSLHHR
jgi:hypothetical protein